MMKSTDEAKSPRGAEDGTDFPGRDPEGRGIFGRHARCRGGIPRRAGRSAAILAILAAALAPAGCKDRSGEAEAAPPESAAGPSNIIAFGSVVTSDRFVANAPWDGRVVDILVWEGQRVSRGDILAAFDPEDRHLVLETARLATEAARSSAEEAGSRLASAEVALAEIGRRLERNRRMVESGSVSEQDFEALQAEYDSAVYERDAAAWMLDARQEEAERAATTYGRLRARSAEPQFEGDSLICPLDEAVVTEIHVRDGSVMELGDLMLVLHDASELIVEAELPEEFVRDVGEGAKVDVVPVADPDRHYPGIVTELAGVARLINGENVVKIRVKLEERDDFLREGFNVDVEIPVGG